MTRFIILLLWLLATCRLHAGDVDATAGAHTVYIVNHGWHTGIIVPAGQAGPAMPFLEERFRDAGFYEFGWGDQGFYQAEEITAWLALKAALVPTDSVMHVVSIPGDPVRYFSGSEIEELRLDEAGLARLLAFVAAGFAYDGSRSVILLDHGIYGNSQFYRGADSYHLFRTCNRWTAEGLQRAGLDIDPGDVLTADAVMEYLADRRVAE